MSDKPEKPEISDAARIAGAIGGVLLGAIVGGIAMAGGTMLAEHFKIALELPSPLAGCLWGAGIGLALGLVFPKQFASFLGDFISSI